MSQLNKLQARLWIDDAIHPSNMYNVAYAFLLEGELNIDKLRDALHQLIAMNPIYSSHIVQDEDGKLVFKENASFILPLEIIELPEHCHKSDLETLTDTYARIPLSKDSCCLCKFYLFHLREHQWCFMPKFHHAVMDGMSMNIFCNRLSELYNGKQILTVPCMQEYNRYLTLADCHAEEDYLYWKEYLSDTSLSVPLDYFDAEDTTHDDRYHFCLGESLFHQCDHFCIKTNTTQFRLQAAVWAATVGRFCTPESGWVVLDHTVNLCPEEFRQTLGNYVNNLPLKIKVTNSLHEILAQMKTDRRKAKIHQFITYTELIPRMKHEKLLSADDALSIGIDYPILNNRLGFSFRRCTSRFFRQPQMDLGLGLCLAVEKDSRFRCHIRYKKNLPLYYIEELAGAFRQLLVQAIASPDTAMDDFPLLTEEREKIILSARPEIVKPEVHSPSVIERFREIVRHYPDHTAIQCGNQCIHYAELYRKVCRAASWIRQQTAGTLEHEAPIGILMDRSPESIVALLGVLATGHPYVPLDKTYPEERINFIIHDCGIRLTIDNESFSYGDEISLDAPHQDDKVAYIIYTSGTTGTPKGTPIRHSQLLNLAAEQIRIFSIRPDSKVLYFASMSFDASVSEIFTALLSGAALIVATETERHDPEQLLRLLAQAEVTCATLPPALLAVLPHRSLPALNTLVIAGDKCSPHLLSFWKEGRTVINAYGPTENTVCATAGVIHDLRRVRNIGLPLRNVSCYVLDDRMRLLPCGVPGELYIGGIQLTGGYINRPELNAQKFLPNPYSTAAERKADVNGTLYKSGDRVRLLPDGTLEFIGRIDAQLKVRGYRIEPAEIEQVLCHQPEISQACVVGKDTETGKRLIAYIQPQPGQQIEISRLNRHLSASLPAYMIPSGYVILKEFPRNVNGKVDVHRLPEPEIREAGIQPENTQEACLVGIVARLLGVDTVGVDSDLTELGLDSLSVMNLVVEAATFGLRVSVASVYRDRTIREIVKGGEQVDYFWHNAYTEDKPVLVIVSGYPHFYRVYQHLVKGLAQRYSVFVFDSYNHHFRDEWSCENLIAFYARIAADELKGKTLHGIAGYCLGGELALLLADRLKKDYSMTPEVWVMDGEAGRDAAQVSQVRYLDDPTVPATVNRQRDRLLKHLLSTFPSILYPGPVHVALSKRPLEHLQYDATRPDSPEELKIARRMHSNRSVLWQKNYPHVPLLWLDTDHYHFLDEKNVSFLLQFISSDPHN